MSGKAPRDEDVEAFLEGDPAAVARIRQTIDGVVRAFHLSDADLSAELVQDALARVFVNLRGGRFRGDSSLKTYAQNVAKYTCLEHVRRRRGEVSLDPDDAESRSGGTAGPEETLLRNEQHHLRLQAFATLPKECRALFRLIFLEGLSYREVASCLGVSEGAIKLRVHRCRMIGLQSSRHEQPSGAADRKPVVTGSHYQRRRTDPHEA